MIPLNDFVISTENTTDLSEKLIRETGVEVIPMSFYMDGVNYDNVTATISVQEFYARMRNKSMPTTSMINPDQAYLFMEKFVKEGKDVLHLAFSSALSGTYESFCTAAKKLEAEYPGRRVRVVDSRAASMGEGLFVWHVAKKRAEGADFEATEAYARSIVQNVCHYFTVDDLNHLHRGGRVSKATAILGTILKIKPLLHVDEQGRLINIGKVRGRKASLQWLVDKMKSKLCELENPVVFISHGDCLDDAEYVRALVQEQTGIKRFEINYIGPIIGTHSGPGTVALFFLGRDRTETGDQE